MASGCKACPMRGGAPCNANCAWFRDNDGGRCAMWQIADRLTDLENIVNSLDSIGEIMADRIRGTKDNGK